MSLSFDARILYYLIMFIFVIGASIFGIARICDPVLSNPEQHSVSIKLCKEVFESDYIWENE